MDYVKVWTELDDGKFKSLPARIISTRGKFFTIQYLSPTSKKTRNNKRIYNYEDETYEITDESIVQQVESELTLGFEETTPGDFIKFDIRNSSDDEEDDEDYIPSSSEDDSEDDDSEEYEDDPDEEEEEEFEFSDDDGEDY